MSGAKGNMQNITIEPVVNGWIIRVGCAPFVALDKDVMLGEISRYIDCPREMLAQNLRNPVNEGAYSPDSTTRQALGQTTAPQEGSSEQEPETTPETRERPLR